MFVPRPAALPPSPAPADGRWSMVDGFSTLSGPPLQHTRQDLITFGEEEEEEEEEKDESQCCAIDLACLEELAVKEDADCGAVMRRILLCDTTAQFLQHILGLEEARTSYVDLIVCYERATFLKRVVNSLKSAAADGADDDDDDDDQVLLSTTLDNIARSQNIGLAFCPTPAHLMAYLGTYRSRGQGPPESGHTKGVLAILDPLTPLSIGSGLSAQRVSKFFSVAAQVAFNGRMKLIMCQCGGIRCDEVVSGADSWSLTIPLLNSNALDCADYQDSTVSLNRVAKRWFRFQRMTTG